MYQKLWTAEQLKYIIKEQKEREWMFENMNILGINFFLRRQELNINNEMNFHKNFYSHKSHKHKVLDDCVLQMGWIPC